MQAGRSHTVLVVDDDPIVCRMIARVLGARGYRTSIAVDPDEARHRFAEERPDFVLCDEHLGGASGSALLDELERELGAAATDVGMALMSGAPLRNPRPLLVKPFSAGDVDAIIQRVLHAA